MDGNYLLVVDMQNDFVTGALGSREAEAIVSGVVKKVREYGKNVIFTMDTHDENYLASQEGTNLPVSHCIKYTYGWQLIDQLEIIRTKLDLPVFEKPTFGSTALGEHLRKLYSKGKLHQLEIVGLCTDICVISNALLAKAFVPEVEIICSADLCAGVTPESHERALEAMKACQVKVEKNS